MFLPSSLNNLGGIDFGFSRVEHIEKERFNHVIAVVAERDSVKPCSSA